TTVLRLTSRWTPADQLCTYAILRLGSMTLTELLTEAAIGKVGASWKAGGPRRLGWRRRSGSVSVGELPTRLPTARLRVALTNPPGLLASAPNAELPSRS